MSSEKQHGGRECKDSASTDIIAGDSSGDASSSDIDPLFELWKQEEQLNDGEVPDSQKLKRLLMLSLVKDQSMANALERVFEPLDLPAILKLEIGDIKKLLLQSGQFIDTISKTIFDCINRKNLPAGREANNKYDAPCTKFGADDAFLEGLDELIGVPDPHILRAILIEHKGSRGFLTSNYKLWTTPLTEMAFVIGRADDVTFLKTLDSKLRPSDKEIDNLHLYFNRLESITKFPGTVGLKESVAQIRICLRSEGRLKTGCLRNICGVGDGLRELLENASFEVDGSILSTTVPMSMYEEVDKNNFIDVLENKLPKNLKFESMDDTERRTWEYVTKFPTKECENADTGANAVCFKLGRERTELKILMKQPIIVDANLRVEEAIAAYLYTGPMYQVICTQSLNSASCKALNVCWQEWNKFLRGQGSSTAEFKGESYITSVHALVSAVTKLSLKSRVSSERKVYRGLGGIRLNDAFFVRDHRNTRGGVEFAFLSTTAKKEIALQYSGADKGAGIIFEIETGKIDSGAHLKTFSQYTTEDEILFTPLANLEVVGNMRVDCSAVGEVLVVPLKINVNLKSMTIEKRIAQRKQQILEMIKNCQKMIDYGLKYEEDHSDGAVASEEVHSHADSTIFTLESMVSAQHPEWFNIDKNFKDCWNYILHAKNRVMARKLGDVWIQNRLKLDSKPTEGDSKPVELLGREEFWMELRALRSQYTSEVVGEVARAHAAKRGLMKSSAATDSGENDKMASSLEDEFARWNRQRENLRADIFTFVRPSDGKSEGWELLKVEDLMHDIQASLEKFVKDAQEFFEKADPGKALLDGSAEVFAKVTQPIRTINHLMVFVMADPLSSCAVNGKVEEMRILLAADCYVGAKEPVYGNTPLHWTAYYGKKDMMEELMEAGADPLVHNREDLFDWTPLHLAAWRGHSDVVRAMLDFLKRKGKGEVLKKLLEEKDTEKVLLPTIPYVTPKGRTALHVAAAHGHVEVFKALLDFKADINAKDSVPNPNPQNLPPLPSTPKFLQVVSSVEEARSRVQPLYI